jgi:hypothetical protein
VAVYYYHQELRDRVKLCKVSRRAGESGVGIFVSWGILSNSFISIVNEYNE